MKLFFRGPLLVFAISLCLAMVGVADVEETIQRYRASFEKRMNAELDEYGNAARKARLNYVDSLKKVKGELARAEKLKAAAQVLDEIELVEGGEDPGSLSPDVDYRFKRVREIWERELSEIQSARGEKLKTTLGIYFRALDAEKRRLTRIGKIKDALVVEEEELRVRGLPEVKAMEASEASEAEPKEPSENLALAARGARASGARRSELLIDGKIEYNKKEGFAFENFPCNFTVDLRSKVSIGQVRILLYDLDRRKYGFRLLVSDDGESWELVNNSEKVDAGWQEINLEDTKARYVRINGLSNTANLGFHVVEGEVYEP